MTADTSLRGKWRRFTGKVGATRREVGPAAAATLAVRWGAAFVHKQASLTRDWIYDRRHGVDTRMEFSEQERPVNPAHDDSLHYRPVSPRVFKRLMRHLDIAPQHYTFLDLGCGKGAALLLALEHGFESVVGVELNDRLVPIARENVSTYKAARRAVGRTEVVLGDVVDFEFPGAPTVLFMFNPFGTDTMKAVLANLERSLKENPREIIVTYVRPVQERVLDDCSFLQRVPSPSTQIAIYRSTSPTS